LGTEKALDVNFDFSGLAFTNPLDGNCFIFSTKIYSLDFMASKFQSVAVEAAIIVDF
jgi:hypothetical protein